MGEVTVKLQTVTPLFLGGSDPRGEPELRVASFRGALRFWLRALLGGVLGDQNLDAVRQAESAVFGSTESASPVVVRVRHGLLSQVPFSHLAAWNNATRKYDTPGIAYLFFAARRAGAQPERCAIAENTPFDLTLSTRVGVGSSGEEAFRRAYAALWLLAHLGGLGARSRRGGGSLQVARVTRTKAVPDDLPPLTVSATTPTGLQDELRDGLSRLRQLVGIAENINDPSAFDVLHPHVCKIWVVNKMFSSWQQVLNEVGEFLLTFRRGRAGIEFPSIVTAANGRKRQLSVMERAVMGLPIIFYDPVARRSVGTLEGIDHDRRASPLLIRVTRLGAHYVALLTWFRARLLPEGERLALKETSGRKRTLAEGQPPSWDWLEKELLPALGKQVGDLQEVTGW